jgi:hypothetical protein
MVKQRLYGVHLPTTPPMIAGREFDFDSPFEVPLPTPLPPLFPSPVDESPVPTVPLLEPLPADEAPEPPPSPSKSGAEKPPPVDEAELGIPGADPVSVLGTFDVPFITVTTASPAPSDPPELDLAPDVDSCPALVCPCAPEDGFPPACEPPFPLPEPPPFPLPSVVAFSEA